MSYYENEDYRAERVTIDGHKKYFLIHHSITGDLQKVEVDEQLFRIYSGEFRKPLRRQENFISKSISFEVVEDYIDDRIISSDARLEVEEFILRQETFDKIKRILDTCTPTQKRRFRLYFQDGEQSERGQILNNVKSAHFISLSMVCLRNCKNIFPNRVNKTAVIWLYK